MVSKRSLAVVLSMFATLAVGVGLAAGATTHAKTFISVDRAIKQSSHRVLVTGTLDASAKKSVCVHGRKIEFNGEGNFPDDVARSSKDGAFAGVVYVRKSEPFGLLVKRKLVTRHGQTVVCKRATYVSD